MTTTREKGIGTADPAREQLTVLDELLEEGLLDTGDLVLFNRRCESMGPVGAVVCFAAKIYGRYDHLGVVIKEADGSLKLIDAGFNGVQYVDLVERIRRSKSHDIAIRRLHVHRTPALREAAKAYAEEVTGRHYKQAFFQMLASGIVTPAQWRRERLYLEVQRLEGQVRGLRRDLNSKALTPLERTALQNALTDTRNQRDAAMDALESSEVSVFENKEDPGSGLFCSELTAAAYQRMGLLPGYPASNTYIPTDFANAQPPLVGRAVAALRREGLNLLGGAYLGEEVLVRQRGRDVVVAAPALHGERDNVDEPSEGGADLQDKNKHRRKRPLTRTATRAGWEAGGPDVELITQALKKYGPTSGLVNAGPEGVPSKIVSLFHPACYRDDQLIDVFLSSKHHYLKSSSQQHQHEQPSPAAGGLYVIVSGEVDLYEQWPSSSSSSSLETREVASPPQFLATLGPGMAFGGNFLNNNARDTIIQTRARGQDVRLWRASGVVLIGDPPTHPRTKEEQGRVMSVLQHHPYFSAQMASKKEREEALKRFFAIHVKKGEMILAQGERGDNFYVLDKGKAVIHRKKGSSDPFVVASSVTPGAFFGEAAVLFNSERGASVMATEDCKLWALSRLDMMELTGKGSPYFLDFFNQHASQEVGTERFMSYDDFYTALYPRLMTETQQSQGPSSPPIKGQEAASSPTAGLSRSFPAPLRLLLRALDPKGTGLISFSELVHLDVWMNSQEAHIVIALKLANRDAGFQMVSLADWAALRDAARRDVELYGGHHQDAMEAEDARFVARTFRRKLGRRGILSLPGSLSANANTLSIPYDEFVRALHSSSCPMVVRRYLGSIREEVEQLRTGWHAMQGRLLHRATTMRGGAEGGTLPHARRHHVEEEDWWEWAKDARVFGVVVSGGIGGAAARLAVAPLERAKILIQTSTARITTLRDAIRHMLDPRYARPPWGGPIYGMTRGFFVGNGLNMLRILPVLATQVYMYQYLRDCVLQPKRPAFPFVSSAPSCNTAKDDPTWALTMGTGPLPPSISSYESDSAPSSLPLEAKHMLAGGFAGVVANLLIHPLDTVRAKITTQQASSRPYLGAIDCARQTVAKEGMRGLWRGALPCSIWAFLYIGINYTCLAMMAPLTQGLGRGARAGGGGGGGKRTAGLYDGRRDRQQQQQSSVAVASVLVAGAIAQAAAYPFDLIRRRMQLSPGSGGGMWAAARMAMQEGEKSGLRGLYRGFPVLLLKLLPTTVISYRVSTHILEKMEE